MKVLKEGHLYSLANFEEPLDQAQTLQFIEKVPAEEGSTQLFTVANGTTNEEVIGMLIDRMKYLNGKFPCKENEMAITKLEESLMWLNKRTADRVKRNVEGKQLA